MFRPTILAFSMILGLFSTSIASAQYKYISKAPTQALLDATYDYEVWAAPSTEGETEFVLWGRFTNNGQWDLVHEFDWMGSADNGSWSDRGVQVFSTWWSAYVKAQNLMSDGEITDYFIEERPVEPNWQFMQEFDRKADAEKYADDLEQWTAQLGSPAVTKIVRVSRSLMMRLSR